MLFVREKIPWKLLSEQKPDIQLINLQSKK